MLKADLLGSGWKVFGSWSAGSKVQNKPGSFQFSWLESDRPLRTAVGQLKMIKKEPRDRRCRRRGAGGGRRIAVIELERNSKKSGVDQEGSNWGAGDEEDGSWRGPGGEQDRSRRGAGEEQERSRR